MKTANSTSKPGLEKPIISADDFGKKRLEFIKRRLTQYGERTDKTWNEVNDFINKGGNATALIDQVVDPELHSRNCPDPSNHQIF